MSPAAAHAANLLRFDMIMLALLGSLIASPMAVGDNQGSVAKYMAAPSQFNYTPAEDDDTLSSAENGLAYPENWTYDDENAFRLWAAQNRLPLSQLEAHHSLFDYRRAFQARKYKESNYWDEATKPVKTQARPPMTSFLQAMAANQIAHTGGHMDLAYKSGMNPAYVDYGRRVEVVPDWVSNPANDSQRRLATDWQNAGFEAQQELYKSAPDAETKKWLRAAGGLYKLLYPLATPPDTNGDVENMKKLSGNRKAGGLLALTGLNDLITAENPKPASWWPDYLDMTTFNQGAPGLKATWEW